MKPKMYSANRSDLPITVTGTLESLKGNILGMQEGRKAGEEISWSTSRTRFLASCLPAFLIFNLDHFRQFFGSDWLVRR
jgi:hypothetical protein